MPLYEYVCRDCNAESEILVRSSTEQPECPKCGSQQLAKLLSVPAAPTSGGAPRDLPRAGGGGCGSGCGCH